MTQFVKYTHVERLGTSETDGILEGTCYVFPKLDGTNASLWLDGDDIIQAGSRNRVLQLGDDNAGFKSEMIQDPKINQFFAGHPHLRLFGEWLVPHSLKTYREDAWRKFYVFDVYEGDRVLYYEEYKPLLDAYGIEYVPPIFIVENPTQERIFSALEQNNFLVKDGEGCGEGVVVKNYAYTNRFGRKSYAKLVTAEFKAKHTKELGPRVIKEKSQVERAIALEFVTKSLVDKTYAKIETEKGSFGSRDIPRLLHTVYYDLIREEMWEILRKHKYPTIDFKYLQNCSNSVVKLHLPALFGVEVIKEAA